MENNTSWWDGIQNRTNLLDHVPSTLRASALDIIEHSIHAADPYIATKGLVKRDGEYLRVGSREYDLKKWNNIFIIGAGKATQPVAFALEEILGERITEGLVILKQGESCRLRCIKVVHAAHPIPDEQSFQGAQELVRIAKQASKGDLVFAIVTGGSSSLAIWPASDITVAEKQAVNKFLLECGATIREINAVRKHISLVKGGRLGLQIFPAELINLTVSDVVGDPKDYITDLTVPDTSTYQDAWRTLDKYHLWNRIPSSVRDHLLRGEEIETPKNYSNPYHTHVIVPGNAACTSAVERCKQLGYFTHMLQTKLEGESRDEAITFVKTALQLSQETFKGKSCAIVSGGETVVTLHGDPGEGGPNQEFALAAAFEISGKENLLVASIGLDGTDGPTEACGGIVDSFTIDRAISAGLDPYDSLQKHLSGNLLRKTGDMVITGPTGTNVNDLIFMLIGYE